MVPSASSTAPLTMFVLGRGQHARPLAAFSEHVAPQDLGRLPIGRKLLTASTTAEVRDHIGRFAYAWHAAELGTIVTAFCALTVPGPEPAIADRPDTDEDRYDLYAFDAGQWWHWPSTDAPQWHSLTIDQHGAVSLVPAARIYGPDYARTAGLSLPGLAAWIMGATTASVEATLSAAVDVDDADIHITVHSGHHFGAITAELHRIAEASNWSNPHDARDRRFHPCIPCIRCTHRTHAKTAGSIVSVSECDIDGW